MNKNIEEVILTAIYETEKFKKIAKNFMKVQKIKTTDTVDEISNNFKNIVLDCINENLDDFVYEYGIKNLRKKVGVSTLKLKKRWYKNALDEHLMKEVEFTKISFIKNGIVNNEFNNVNALRENRVKFLNAWKSDIKYNVTDYPYLYVISEKKIINAFKNDIILCITEKLMNEYDYNIDNITLKTPAPIAPSLFAQVKSDRKKIEEIQYKSDLLSVIEDDIGNRTDYFYKIEKPSTDEEYFKLELNTSFKLDEQDLKIIRYAYTYSYHDFNTFNTNEILEFLGLSNNKYNREKIENKFLNLPKYNFYAEKISPDGNKKSQTVFNLFSAVTIERDENTEEYLIHTAKSNLFRLNPFSMEIMYKKELLKLNSESAKSVAYFLEGRRLYLINQGIDLSVETQNITLRELKKYVAINLNKPKEAVSIVSKILDEIIENKFILKSYKIEYYSFNINFYKSDERKKLLLDKTIISLPEN